MRETCSFRSAIVLLWFRLTSLAIFGLVFAEALELASGKLRGWSFYLTFSEVAFEATMHLIFAALTGMALGTICTALLAVFLRFFTFSRDSLLEWSTRVAVVSVVFLDSKLALAALIKCSYQISEHRGVFDTLLFGVYYLAFIVVIYLPRPRKSVFASFGGLLQKKWMRAVTTATWVSTIALVLVQFALVKTAPTVKASSRSPRPKSNFLLITFDALSAEDVSTYGYKLPTTPNIDAFARAATVFTNFYSASTFTTPCVATVLTGMYPPESHVYHLQGKLKDATNSLPYLLQAGGYSTVAFFSNPFAYYFAASSESQYDILPHPIFQPGVFQYLWDATSPLHQDSGVGSRVEEYRNLAKAWQLLARGSDNLHERYPAAATFQEALKISANLPEGFFLWIHVMTPHGPYYPDPQTRGRFIDPGIQEIFEGKNQPRWRPHYPRREQSEVDRYRLRYDEFILTADRAFGAFMSDFEKRSDFQNTTVIVSADHGESFEGGMYQHGGPHLTRPVIHVPLIIKTPGQQQGRKVAVTADETALAPTIVELAGLQKPDWMHGQSLAPWLSHDKQDSREGLAFSQYFEKNSIFEPLRHGSVGVIDSQYEYVLNLDAKKGALRPLNEAHIWNLDRSAENPAKAQELLAAIYSRFPEVRQDTK